MLPYTMPTISGHWPMSELADFIQSRGGGSIIGARDTLWTAAAIIPVGEPVAAKVLALKNKHNVDSRDVRIGLGPQDIHDGFVELLLLQVLSTKRVQNSTWPDARSTSMFILLVVGLRIDVMVM
jgi:hypothetical protein